MKPSQPVIDPTSIATNALDQKPRNIYAQWNLNRANIERVLIKESLEATIQTDLSLAILMAYIKIATISNHSPAQFQISPINIGEKYYRGSENKLFPIINDRYQAVMKLQSEARLYVIDGPISLAENLTQNHLHLKIDKNIGTKEEFSATIQAILDTFSKQQNLALDRPIFLNCTAYLSNIENDQNLELKVKDLEKIFFDRIKNLNSSAAVYRKVSPLISILALFAFNKYEEQDFLIVPKFLKLSQEEINKGNEGYALGTEIFNALFKRTACSKTGIDKLIKSDLQELIISHGFMPTPDEAMHAWLKIVESHDTILDALKITTSRMPATPSQVTTEVHTLQTFLDHSLIQDFLDLEESLDDYEDKIPYLQILPKVTIDLLRGFKDCSIDDVFVDKQIEELLSSSYSLMLDSMQKAVKHKHDFRFFRDAIELLHQQIQMILIVVKPHDPTVLSQAIIRKIYNPQSTYVNTSIDALNTSEPSMEQQDFAIHAPIIPGDLESPRVHLRTSGMRSLSSIISSIATQADHKSLHIVALKGSYFESLDQLKRARQHNLSIIASQELLAYATANQSTDPIDVLLCEFHHNASSTERFYVSEDIRTQIKALLQQRIAKYPLHVVIDTTIHFESSNSLKELLHDSLIKYSIQEGNLNVVLLRSAQKFDLLGMDNYMGGISISINQPDKFTAFNTRMDLPEDQLDGLSYQGIAHLQKYAGNYLDMYREALMMATHRFYELLPQSLLYAKGRSKPIQVSINMDSNLVFIAIKFDGYPHTFQAFEVAFIRFMQPYLEGRAARDSLPITSRASFGFINTNLQRISPDTFRLNPGLEDRAMFNEYQTFFRTMDNIISDIHLETEKKDIVIAERIKAFIFPKWTAKQKNETVDIAVSQKIRENYSMLPI